MKIKLVEVTNGPANWGKFLIGQFDDEWSYKSVIDGAPLLSCRGWSPKHVLVLDLQTGEGAMFLPGGFAKADLDKHCVWVCPLFEPFLTWLYAQPDPFAISAHVDLPDAPFAMSGYRRPGANEVAMAVVRALRLSEKQRQCLEYVAQGDKPPFKRTTVQSLERQGLVELEAGVGWRATREGVAWLTAHSAQKTGAGR